MAAERRNSFLKRYGRPASDDGVNFLTGRQSSIDALTEAIGFKYSYDEAIDQYAHPAVLTVLTPEGRVSRYLFGIEFAPRDLKFALIDASSGAIGSAVDQAVLFCYLYDPTTGSYGFAVMTAVRVAGLLTVACLGAFILVNLRRERRQDRAAKSAATGIR
jgi:protein SCO1/2